MSKRRIISEKVKNIIIALLLVSAVFLGWQSRLFGNSSAKLSVFSDLVGDKTTGSDNGGVQETGKKIIGEARPLSIAVTDSSGAHYGVKYALKDIDTLYNNTINLFAEALGSAQILHDTDEQNWRIALSSPSVYFEYMSPIPLSVLDGWFGNDTLGDWGNIATRRLCVAVVDGGNRLFFQDNNTGRFYTADTAIKLDSITNLSDTYDANNACFAFESISNQSLKDPYTLLIPDATGHPLVEAKNPLSDETTQTEVLEAFGVSVHLKPISEDGANVYIDSNFTLRVWPDGRVRYTLKSTQDSSTAHVDEREAVALAHLAISDSIGKYCGDEVRVYLYAISSGDANDYKIMFRYIVAGGQIYLNPEGYAAIVTIEDGIITEMALHFRNYTMTDNPIKLLPEIQAAAAAGGAFILCYADNGNDSLEPSWVVVPLNSGA